MNKTLLVGMTAVLLIFAGAVSAYPTLAGPSGNGVLPTAVVTPGGQFNLAADLYNTSNSDADVKDSYPIRVLYGINDSFEIGGGYNLLQAGGMDANTWNINAKYQIMATEGSFGLALGARYARSDVKAADAILKTTNVYLAGTVPLTQSETGSASVNATFGVNWENADGTVSGVSGSNSALRPFVSLDATFGNQLQLSGDYQIKNDDLDSKALYAITARYMFNDSFGGEIGYTNADVTGMSGVDDSHFFAGINLMFGGMPNAE